MGEEWLEESEQVEPPEPPEWLEQRERSERQQEDDPPKWLLDNLEQGPPDPPMEEPEPAGETGVLEPPEQATHEVRVDGKTYSRLATIADEYSVPVSEVVRTLSYAGEGIWLRARAQRAMGRSRWPPLQPADEDDIPF